jgi:hypothetical protein
LYHFRNYTVQARESICNALPGISDIDVDLELEESVDQVSKTSNGFCAITHALDHDHHRPVYADEVEGDNEAATHSVRLDRRRRYDD